MSVSQVMDLDVITLQFARLTMELENAASLASDGQSPSHEAEAYSTLVDEIATALIDAQHQLERLRQLLGEPSVRSS